MSHWINLISLCFVTSTVALMPAFGAPQAPKVLAENSTAGLDTRISNLITQKCRINYSEDVNGDNVNDVQVWTPATPVYTNTTSNIARFSVTVNHDFSLKNLIFNFADLSNGAPATVTQIANPRIVSASRFETQLPPNLPPIPPLSEIETLTLHVLYIFEFTLPLEEFSRAIIFAQLDSSYSDCVFASHQHQTATEEFFNGYYLNGLLYGSCSTFVGNGSDCEASRGASKINTLALPGSATEQAATSPAAGAVPSCLGIVKPINSDFSYLGAITLLGLAFLLASLSLKRSTTKNF